MNRINPSPVERESMVLAAYQNARPAMIALTRDNTMYDMDDVSQQMYMFIIEAVDKDKGLGDFMYYTKWYAVNRLKNWMRDTVGKRAHLECQLCHTIMPMEAVKHRSCECGAGSDDISSITHVDYATDLEFTKNQVRDDHTAFAVRDFIDSIENERDRDIMIGYIADTPRSELAKRHGVSPARISQILNRIKREISKEFANA